MNDRIQQLLLQVVSRAGEDGEYLPSLHTPQDIERFAELIVRECVEQIKLKGTDWIDWQPSQLGIRPEYVAMAQHIKQHFGVRE